ncbi:UDP-N-acetylmuramoyl-tripeptide--D-alanyl-D-alanine ligase [Vibrio sp. SCSIO 43136]|uniref:UDP-N-acetylmuramoyl-tripeptide--D-alanyl-D- alanine ligase n=1 Tax=Vibrio sp. SCSIO 43136 TaxID=2819101 RepID=UPI0020759A01|nr:UDP-N-acetylmuramoyl-tripeptide--D-alanyl-D-alanine ligase [Vibrio sp. SCSIO 43136]USD64869.1 UDP-N-acetylmuramoyl-tripeptide--D-alanyl-D-alanine ligase [Vibrio sp. SCSIO 43136]
MIEVSLSQLAKVLDGQLYGDDCLIDQVSTDTRTLAPGSLFVALVGERFDAHNFCDAAKQSGASAILVERRLDLDIPQLVVTDTQLALGKASSWVYQQCSIPTIALTGSCGKTTVKEMLAAILEQKGKVLATAGNFNNEIGVPLTLLRADDSIDFGVIELGANHIGEIQYTSALVKPDIALVNNVAAAHLEGFGSIDGVKQAKGEIYQGLKPNGIAVINLDSQGDDYWQEALADKQRVTIAKSNVEADFFSSDLVMDESSLARFTLHTPQGQVEVALSVVGEHNVANAVAAAALAQNSGASLTQIQHGLANMTNMSGRVEVIELSEHIRLIDDSYNASVPAMKAAVDLLANYRGQRWLILGFMAELGEESLELHRQVGQHAAPFQFEHVLTYGEDTKVISDVCGGDSRHFDTHQQMITYIKQQLAAESGVKHTLLVKGANSAGMSQVVAALKENH